MKRKIELKIAGEVVGERIVNLVPDQAIDIGFVPDVFPNPVVVTISPEFGTESPQTLPAGARDVDPEPEKDQEPKKTHVIRPQSIGSEEKFGKV